jgi:hypothetical protein
MSGSPDLSAFPLVRLDQLPDIDTPTLERCLTSLDDLLHEQSR